MNRFFALLGSTILSTLLLASCESPGNGGETVKYPTVSDIEGIDRRMGLEPRQVRPRSGSSENYETPAPAPAPAPAPEPAPELAPAPAPEQSAPPPQPSVDAETLQKLR